MPRAKKEQIVPMEVDDESVVVQNKRKGNKRRAEDHHDGSAPSKAPRVLGKSKQPTIVNGNHDPPAETGAKGSNSKASGIQRQVSVKSKKKDIAVSNLSTSTVTLGQATATLHCFGNNDCGQIGFPDSVSSKKFPQPVPGLENKKMKDVACGGMHTVALEDNGTVWTFGVNDDLALGRVTEEEEDGFTADIVQGLPKNIIQVSAGDSHSAALTADGQVFAWGCFKDTNGNFGLIVSDGGQTCRLKPENITSHLEEKIVKISSGGHHIVMLGAEGHVYTCGTGDQGQLGRKEPEAKRVTRSMGSHSTISRKEYLLKPAILRVGRNPKFTDVWAGEYSTYFSTEDGNDVYVCGLNNYSQLGINNANNRKNVIIRPTKNNTFKGRKWKQIAAGQHHTVALDEDGKVFTLGRASYGRLGLEFDQDTVEMVGEPTLVGALTNKRCVRIAAGSSTSYAITEDGNLFAWGFGENFQLATGDEDDREFPTECSGQCLRDKRAVLATAGGQHVAVTIAVPPTPNGEH